MFSKVTSCGIFGIDGYKVEVEVDISAGIPSFSVVGLPDSAVKESRERVKSALKNSGFNFPPKRIVVNLAPADIKKEGSFYDLPIALGIISAQGLIKIPESYCFIGELSLEGEIKPVKGALIVSEWAKKQNLIPIIPKSNFFEAKLGNENIIPVSTLGEVVSILRRDRKPEYPTENIYEEDIFSEIDFGDIRGQEFAKRALIIASAGGHNLLMIGPPGAGKTILAKSINSILPELSEEEAIEITKIYSVAGLLKNGKILRRRPFRSPHHTASEVALVGGGQIPKPGEVSLSHLGVLFLDELPEFKRNALEALRIPLENGEVTISRSQRSITFPANFQLVAAMNPCPCGNFRNPKKECRCSPYEIKKYVSKVSGPLLDRIDIQIEVPALSAEEILGSKEKVDIKSIRERIFIARERQKKRFPSMKVKLNSRMPQRIVEEVCKLDSEGRKILSSAIDKLSLSARAVSRILKISRTIADIEEEDNILPRHLLEAINLRRVDKFFDAIY